MSFDTYSWLLFFTAFLSLVIAIAVYNKRFTNGKAPFISLMMMIAIWALAGSLENAVFSYSAKMLFAKLEYIGAQCTPVLFLMFVIGFSQRKKLSNIISLYWIIPILLIVLAFTNRYHGLVWKSIEWGAYTKYKLIFYNGSAFFISTAYPVLLIIWSMILIIRTIPRSPEYFGKQLVLILIISLAPFLLTAVYASRIIPILWLDIRPIGYMISGLILLVGIYQYNLFSLTPIARDILVEKMRGCVLVLDRQKYIIDVNSTSISSLNLPEDWLWKKLSQLLPSLDRLLDEPFESDEKSIDLYMEEPVKAWFDISVSKLYTKHRHIFGYLYILRDITAKKKYERLLENYNTKLTASQQQLRELNNQKNKLLSIIGHDLRNPFHQILGLSQVIAQSDESLDRDELKSMGKMLYQSAKKGEFILKNLLEWSQIQAKGIQFNPSKTDLNKIITEAIQMVDMLAAEKKIMITLESSDENIAEIDKYMMLTVIRNLLSNAIKFSFENSTITVSVKQNEDNYVIVVSDQGVGIKPEDINKLFRIDEKFTNPGTSGEQGTGLGLSLCKEFIDKHNGNIRVESELNQGSNFIISLPCKNTTIKVS